MVIEKLAEIITAFNEARADLDNARAEVVRMKARMDLIEEGGGKAGLAYRGVWQHDETYEPGMCATDRGALWYCRGSTRGERPGSSSSWQLMHKSDRSGA